MNALGVGCALFLLVNSALEPGELQCRNEVSRVYQIQLKLVEVRPDGARNYAELPAMLVADGRTRREFSGAMVQKKRRSFTHVSAYRAREYVTCMPPGKISAKNAHFAWAVQVRQKKAGAAVLYLTLQRQRREGTFYQGNLTGGKEYVIEEPVQVGKIGRFVLTRDGQKLPTSWVEVLVEQPQHKTDAFSSPAAQSSQPGQKVELYPFWYDPF